MCMFNPNLKVVFLSSGYEINLIVGDDEKNIENITNGIVADALEAAGLVSESDGEEKDLNFVAQLIEVEVKQLYLKYKIPYGYFLLASLDLLDYLVNLYNGRDGTPKSNILTFPKRRQHKSKDPDRA